TSSPPPRTCRQGCSATVDSRREQHAAMTCPELPKYRPFHRKVEVKRWRQGVPCGAAHHGPVPDTRASSSAGCAGRVAGRREAQRCRCTRWLPPSVSEGEADAQRLRQGLWAPPTRRMTVRTPSRACPLLSWTILSRRTEALWSSMGEGGGRPTAVRHTYATGKPVISRAEIVDV